MRESPDFSEKKAKKSVFPLNFHQKIPWLLTNLTFFAILGENNFTSCKLRKCIPFRNFFPLPPTDFFAVSDSLSAGSERGEGQTGFFCGGGFR